MSQDRSREHTVLCRDIEVELSKFADVLVTSNPSGKARYGSAVVPYGAFAPGGPDMLVVVRIEPYKRLLRYIEPIDSQLAYMKEVCEESLSAKMFLGVVASLIASIHREQETRAVIVAIEAKTGSATQSPEQRQCQRRLERVGVRYVVARSVADAVNAIEIARRPA